jgi:long-chain acyl-CoA synthetase
VEEAIRQHSAVADVVVIGVPDPIRGQVPKAYIVLAKDAQLSGDGLKVFLADKLSPVEIPRLVEFRNKLPKSAVGKVLKRAV